MKKAFTLFIGLILVSLSSFSQYGRYDQTNGYSHFYFGSRWYMMETNSPEISYYKKNFRNGYSQLNYNFGYGYSVIKKWNWDIQPRVMIEYRSRNLIGFSQVPQSDGNFDKMFYQLNDEVDLDLTDLSINIGVSAIRKIVGNPRWTHCAGASILFGIQGSEYNFHSNSNSTNEQYWKYSSFSYNPYYSSFDQINKDEYRVFQTYDERYFLDWSMIFSSQVKLSPQFYIRIENKLGFQSNLRDKDNLRPSVQLFGETSISLSLWEFRGSRKILKMERKTKRKQKRNAEN